MKNKIVLIVLITALVGCNSPMQNKPGYCYGECRLNEFDEAAVLYNELSGEYHALSYQAFHLARFRVDSQLSAIKNRSDSFAVIVDLDETILNNSAFQGQLIIDDSTYGQEWKHYINQIKATAMPGAVDFLNYVDGCNKKFHCNKIRIFYITNRDSSQFTATAKNLARLHFPQIDTVNFNNDFNLMVVHGKYTNNKQSRFQWVRDAHYQVLLQMGDNLNDFSGDFYAHNDHYRDSLVTSRQNSFGKNYIVLPNSMYGDWVTGLCKQNIYALHPRVQDSIRYISIKGYK